MSRPTIATPPMMGVRKRSKKLGCATVARRGRVLVRCLSGRGREGGTLGVPEEPVEVDGPGTEQEPDKDVLDWDL